MPSPPSQGAAARGALEGAKRDPGTAGGEAGAAQAKPAEAKGRAEERERAPAEPSPPLPVSREVQVHAAAETANGEHPARATDTHLMSVPTPSGFVLLERPGPTPAVGTQVRFEEEPDTTFVVTKVNAASDANPRPCAFLERL